MKSSFSFFYTASQALGVVTMGDWFAFHIEKKRHKLPTVLAALHLALDIDAGDVVACDEPECDEILHVFTAAVCIVNLVFAGVVAVGGVCASCCAKFVDYT